MKKLPVVALILILGWACRPSGATDEPRVIPSRLLSLIFADVTRSLVQQESGVVVTNVTTLLPELPSGSEFRIYPIQYETEIVAPLLKGSIVAPRHGRDLEPRQRMQAWKRMAGEKLKSLYGDYADFHEDNQSCILNSLRTADAQIRAFASEYKGEPHEVNLIFISDMIEECSTTPLGQAVELDKNNIRREIDLAATFDCPFDFSQARIGVVIPATVEVLQNVDRSRRPSLSDRQAFWQKIFVACKFPEAKLRDGGSFSFQSDLPRWLERKGSRIDD